MKKIFRQTAMLMILLLGLSVQSLAMPDALIPVGKMVGIHLSGELVVAGFDESCGAGAQAAGVRAGDRIVSINGERVGKLADLRTAAEGKQSVLLTVEREGKQIEFCLSPVQTQEGKRIGLKIREGVTGVGTVTYYDPATGSFGALGHSVNDPETGTPIPMTNGAIMAASVSEVIKGRPGAPGELHGSFDKDDRIGEIHSNTSAGIFGTMQQPNPQGTPLPLATAQQVELSGAEILANVAGDEVKPYQVEIVDFEPNNRSGRNFLLHICDEDLLQCTGGVVQGMSGAPLVQNGKLVGAVTHVLVNDPSRGYGIFIENMLDAA